MDKPFFILSNNYSIRERQTKQHGKKYDVIFRVVTQDGDYIQKVLSGYSTKTGAKQGYNDFVAEFCEFTRHNPFKKKKTRTDEPTIRKLCLEYLIELKPYNKESVIYDKTNIYAKYVYPSLGDKKVEEIDKPTLIEWQDDLARTKATGRETNLSAKYIRKIRGHLSAMFKWANDKYGYNLNFDGVRQTVVRKKKNMSFWTREDFDKFIAVVDDERLKMLFSFMFFTGRRQGEIFALSPDDIKGNEIVWEKSVTRKTLKDNKGNREPFKVTSTKEDKVQVLPVTPELQKMIASYKGEKPFYFGGERPCAPNTITRKFQRYTAKSGLPRIRIHDLRHSFASMLLKNGENVLVIAELIGDTPEQVIKTYCHISRQDLRNAVDKI